MKLKEITSGLSLAGVEPTQIVSVVATVPLGDGALQLIYRTPDGGMKERLLGSGDEASITVATVERPFSFDGDGAAFQLTCEAKRIDLAFLFDPMMAVHTSNVDALPHLDECLWNAESSPTRLRPHGRPLGPSAPSLARRRANFQGVAQ